MFVLLSDLTKTMNSIWLPVIFLQLLVKEFSSAVNAQKNKVNQLEDDTSSLADDISSLKKQAGNRAADADKALEDVEKTYKRAKDLDSDIQKMLKKIQGKNKHQPAAGPLWSPLDFL